MGSEIPAASMEASKAKLEELKATKGRLSRLVGEARKTGGNPDELIAEVQRVAAEIKQLQKLVKKQLNKRAVQKKWVPPSVSIPQAIGKESPDQPITVEPGNAQIFQDAEAYVAGHPASSIWHRPRISSFIQRTYGHKTRYFCALGPDGSIVGVLPIVQLKSRLFGNFLVSMPYFNYGGVLADNREITEELLAKAEQWRQELQANHLEMRFCQGNALGLPERTDKVSFWLPLPYKTEDLWDSFLPKLRAQIRRGEREMDGFTIGGQELLDEFYRVFSVNMRDLGTPVYSKVFFRNLLETLKGEAWLVVVRIRGKAVGCAFLTGYRSRMEIPWASTLRKYSHTSINMIMYWKVLEFAIQQGFEVFDFGRCSKDAGTYRFKQQWGAEPVKLYWDYLLPEGESLPKLNPNNPKFRVLIAVWQRLPVWLANLIGPPIVKALP
ncbi:FemAB family PEP-CTERM system-associated protein [Marinobacter szutsaonensis]